MCTDAEHVPDPHLTRHGQSQFVDPCLVDYLSGVMTMLYMWMYINMLGSLREARRCIDSSSQVSQASR